MDYNINFQVAALIIVALLLHHFLTQKKLHNANAKIFTYVLILAGLYILLDRINTLIIINLHRREQMASCWLLQESTCLM